MKSYLYFMLIFIVLIFSFLVLLLVGLYSLNNVMINLTEELISLNITNAIR